MFVEKVRLSEVPLLVLLAHRQRVNTPQIYVCLIVVTIFCCRFGNCVAGLKVGVGFHHTDRAVPCDGAGADYHNGNVVVFKDK